MKLLFAHDNRFYNFGGEFYSTGITAEVFNRYLAVFDDIVVCGREIKNKKVGSLASANGVTFQNVQNKNAIAIFLNKADRKHIYNLVKSVDFVIARLDSFIGFIAIKYAKKLGIPYLIELCTDPWDCYINYGWKGKLLAPFVTLKTKREVLNAPRVIYVTENYLQRKYPTLQKNTNISNVECNPNKNLYSQKLAEYKSFNSVSDTIILGTAGALLPFKGQRFVLKAMKILADKGISVKYRIAGSGSDDIHLKKLAKELGISNNVEFLGALNKSEMIEFYQSLTIYIQPSLQEGLPRTVIEAMSLGLYCLGSKTAGIPELLPSNAIFLKKDYCKIAEIIQSLSSNDLVNGSIRNFEESFKYESKTLNNRREDFLSEWVNE